MVTMVGTQYHQPFPLAVRDQQVNTRGTVEGIFVGTYQVVAVGTEDLGDLDDDLVQLANVRVGRGAQILARALELVLVDAFLDHAFLRDEITV
ncbi:MAG: hypothetical protein DRI34_05565 [Deltaproteobacteria bacterium]|nr:MAG: hypothetical protein DRI34_05565 [Deltaproteobacteria bacterium]